MAHGYRRWLYPLIELVVHVWVGSLLFALVFAPAVALEFGIKLLEGRVSETLLAVLKVTKVVAVVLDAVLYAVMREVRAVVSNAAWRAVRVYFAPVVWLARAARALARRVRGRTPAVSVVHPLPRFPTLPPPGAAPHSRHDSPGGTTA